MGKRQCVAMVMMGAAMFAAGFIVRMAWDGYAEKQASMAVLDEEDVMAEQGSGTTPEELAAAGYLAADEIQIRVNDGEVQWYDGRLWHGVATVEELEKQDRFYLAGEAFEAFAEALKEEKAAMRQENTTSEEGPLLVGQREVKPVEQPKTSNTRPSGGQTAGSQSASSEPEAPSDDGWNDSWNDNNHNNSNNGGNDSSQGSGGGQVEPPAADIPADSGGGDTGDGENMEWSDDYL